MSHKSNDEFYLYTGLTANGNECYDALMHMNQSGIPFRHLHYGNPVQQPEVLESIATWFAGENIEIAFPFVTYMEVYEVTDPESKKARIANGIDAIKNTNWSALANFQG